MHRPSPGIVADALKNAQTYYELFKEGGRESDAFQGMLVNLAKAGYPGEYHMLSTTEDQMTILDTMRAAYLKPGISLEEANINLDSDRVLAAFKCIQHGYSLEQSIRQIYEAAGRMIEQKMKGIRHAKQAGNAEELERLYNKHVKLEELLDMKMDRIDRVIACAITESGHDRDIQAGFFKMVERLQGEYRGLEYGDNIVPLGKPGVAVAPRRQEPLPGLGGASRRSSPAFRRGGGDERQP